MVEGAVTFDFHNTLAFCDQWFELEVRGLASAFLRWHANEAGDEPDTRLEAEADLTYRRLREAIKRHGDELTAEASVARVLAHLGVAVDEEVIAVGVERLMRETLEEVRLLPGAEGTIRTLASDGVPLGIVSSAVYHRFLEWTLERCGLLDEFDVVVTSASAGFYKSRPELFHHAATALGVAPDQVIHVGDSYRFDVEGARRAGMKTVWVRSEPGPPPRDAPRPDLTITSLEGAAPPILDLLGRRHG